MSTVRVVLGTTFNTTTGSHTVTATPAVGDLIVIVCGNSGITSNPTVSDNQSGTYTQINGALFNASASKFFVYIRDSLVSSAVSTIYTVTGASSTGGGLTVLALGAMVNVGSAASVQTQKQENQAAAGTPAPVLGTAANTANTIIGAVYSTKNPATLTPRTGYSEHADVGYNTPTTGMEVMSLNNGETAATIAWGGASGSAFASIVVEISSNPYAIISGDGFQAQAGDPSVLSTTYQVTVADSFQAQTGDPAEVGTGVTYNISSGDGFQAQTGDLITIGVVHPIVSAEGTQTQTGDPVTVRAIYILTGAEGSQAQTGDACVSFCAYPLTISEGAQDQTGDLAIVDFIPGFVATNIVCSDGFQAQFCDRPVIYLLTAHSPHDIAYSARGTIFETTGNMIKSAVSTPAVSEARIIKSISQE